MAGVLLDTNAMIWFLNGSPMSPGAFVAIAQAQRTNELYVSPITGWEAALAIRKRNPVHRPNLLGRDAATWFRLGARDIGARIVPIGSRVAAEAARVPEIFGSGDPGDCFIIATARIKRASVMTRDGPMKALATRDPSYLHVIEC